MKIYKLILPALIAGAISSCSTGYTVTNAPADYRIKMVQLDKLSIGLHLADAGKKAPGNISVMLMLTKVQIQSGLKISDLSVTLQEADGGRKYIVNDTVYIRYSADTVTQRHEEVLNNRDLLNGKIIRIPARTTYTFAYRYKIPDGKQPLKKISAVVEFNQSDTAGNITRVTKTFNFQRNRYLNVAGN